MIVADPLGLLVLAQEKCVLGSMWLQICMWCGRPLRDACHYLMSGGRFFCRCFVIACWRPCAWWWFDGCAVSAVNGLYHTLINQARGMSKVAYHRMLVEGLKVVKCAKRCKTIGPSQKRQPFNFIREKCNEKRLVLHTAGSEHHH